MSAVKFLKLTNAVNALLKSNSMRRAHNLASASYAQTLVNLPETNVTTLENGFKIATEHRDSAASTVGLWIDAGSRYETPETNGVANFFEHMAFKGTQQRSEKDIETEIEKMGAEFSSYTDREETAFYAKCLASDIPKAVDILADIVINSKLDEQHIEEQRKVIFQELKEAETDLRLVTYDYLHLTGYQGTPLGKTIFGPSKNIQNIAKEDLSYYVRNNFVAPRMALVANGDVNHDEMVKLAEKYFTSVPYTYEAEIPLIKPCRFTGSEIRDRDDWLPYCHAAIAIDTCGHNSPDIYPLMLAKTIVGSWDRTLASSEHTVNKLIQNIHKGKGCFSYEAFHTLYRDTGLWGCYFVMEGMTLDDFIFNLQNEWMRICISVTETDLKIAKNMLRCNLIEHLDSTTNTCVDIGRKVLHYGERDSFEEVEENIQAVNLQQMKDVCSKYIYDRCPAVVGVGPVEALTDYNRVRANMYWLRY